MSVESPLKITRKKYFFPVLAFSLLQILRIEYLPGKKSVVNNF